MPPRIARPAPGPRQARTKTRTRPNLISVFEQGRISNFGEKFGRGAGLAQTEAAEPVLLFQAFCALFGPKESGDEAVR